MRISMGLLVGLVLTAPAMAEALHQSKDLPKEYLGTYKYLSGKQGDQPIPEDNLGGDIVFTADKIIQLDGEGNEAFVFDFKVDEAGDVVKLSMEITKSVMEETVGALAKGLLKREGTKVTLIYDYAEVDRHPNDFKPDSPTQNLFVIEKQVDVDKSVVYGTYKYVRGQRGEDEVPSERLVGTVKISESKLSLTDEAGVDLFVIEYSIDEEAMPAKFTMEIVESEMPETVGAVAKGLAKHDTESGTLTLIYDYAEGATHPKSFQPESATQHLFVMKKIDD